MRQRQQNIVAKYCCRFNKPKVEVDKKVTYKRKEKHCKRFEDQLIVFVVELLTDLRRTKYNVSTTIFKGEVTKIPRLFSVRQK